ncbi:unnamed protein product, partial [Allacma fusca]
RITIEESAKLRILKFGDRRMHSSRLKPLDRIYRNNSVFEFTKSWEDCLQRANSVAM